MFRLVSLATNSLARRKKVMPKPITDDQASPQQEIAEIEQAVGSKAEEAEQTENQEQKSAFDELAEKKGFESVDDLVSAYTNLEGKMTPNMTELKELRGIVDDIKKSTKPEEKDEFADLPEEQREAIGLLEQLFERKLESKLSPILKKFETDEAKEEIDIIKKSLPGTTDEELNEALTYMQQYKGMTLERAVKLASYDRASKQTKTSSKRIGKNQKNKRAFSESASGSKSGDDTDYSKMDIKDLEEFLNIPSGQRLNN